MQVYLYVSASKCVVGCVMLQLIDSACLALPGEDGAASTADSCPLQLTSTPAHPACQPLISSLPAGLQDKSQLHVDRQPSQGVFPVDWAPSWTQVHRVKYCSTTSESSVILQRSWNACMPPALRQILRTTLQVPQSWPGCCRALTLSLPAGAGHRGWEQQLCRGQECPV